ncbi:short-chain fatty acids transporter [Algoriphagus boritolerans DSM 17298 = JCM 18970]|uniref:Short-chain fatty acids transporter n=1 Tax=Algoriphagus boritolerans DSM 17298 = JCM 18970 TaxID=1120964 RepID=A0A1H5WZ49_9BACT|nr:short-chain fatty acids transporter [Algoriphagus boritolerans DSM 17298 = JCM 18970]
MGKSPAKNHLESLVSPFGLVLILTFFTFFLVLTNNSKEDLSTSYGIGEVLGFWQNGFFGLMGFTLQMMMILVFGYALAIFKPVNSFLRSISQIPKNLVTAVLLTASVTLVAGLLNWGFGLIVGALLARFVHEALVEKGIGTNAALLAATGYLGMSVWHGGLSGSAPLTVAEQGHFLEKELGVIPVEATIFSEFNLLITGGLVFVFLLTAWFLAKSGSKSYEGNEAVSLDPMGPGVENNLARVAGLFMLLLVILGVVFGKDQGLGFISLNWINFLLFAVTLIVYRSPVNFSNAVAKGLKSSADIFIQFPFYAGILGLITDSGLLATFAEVSIELISPELFPIFTFFSAGLVNLFVPSGGGQWAIQGPIIFETATALSLDTGKMIMVFAYGDQISNLLQPFWALPLLSITGVSVRKIFPYTLIFFIVGLFWLSMSLFLFF